MTGAEVAEAPAREVGWWRPLFAAIALLVLPATPIFPAPLPLEQSLVLVVPILAVCAVAGWRAGGRLPLAIFWVVAAAWVLWVGSANGGSFSLLASGWAFVLAASFGSMLLIPVGASFLPKALLALVATFLIGGLLVLLAPGGVSGTLDVLGAELSRRGEIWTAQWHRVTGSLEWQDVVRSNPDAGALSELFDQRLAAMPGNGRLLASALLGLESLAAMAMAWALYHRVGRARVGPPLARLRDLRFDDTLIWGVVAGLVIVVLPITGVVRILGINLLVFFGALYALRGLGVLVWFLGPSRWMTAFLVLFTVFFAYVVAAVATFVGLGDTWFDWRRRPRQRSQRSE